MFARTEQAIVMIADIRAVGGEHDCCGLGVSEFVFRLRVSHLVCLLNKCSDGREKYAESLHSLSTTYCQTMGNTG